MREGKMPRRSMYDLCHFFLAGLKFLAVDTCARLIFQCVSEKQALGSNLLIRVAP